MDVDSPLNYERILTLQLHLFSSHLLTFYNVFFVETFKNMNRGIPISVVNHSHMLHQSSQLPFAIVNGTHIVHRKNLINLLQGMVMQPAVKFGFFLPIFKMCEQLASISRIFSEEANNPYYLLISPLRKLQVYLFNGNFKKHFFETTHYINQDHQKQTINEEYFRYKVNTLAKYVQDFKKANNIDFGDIIREQNETQTQLQILCTFAVFALFRTLKQNTPKLYQIVKQCKELQQFEGRGLQKLGKGHKKQEAANVYISTVKPLEEEKGKDEQREKNPKLLLYQKFAKPVIGLFLFWKIYNLNLYVE